MRVKQELVKIQECIDKLEAAGGEIVLYHKHNLKDMNYGGNPKMPIAHATCMMMEYKGYIYKGFAYCSVFDNFDPLIGTQKAFNRMMESFSDNYGRLYIKEIFT